ncbi:hypothetical protein LTR28_001620, partial [Elasticomyces elasticus]
MSHYRPSSPGGRRIVNPARASDSWTTDPYYAQRGHYVSPRSSNERVIPLSVTTYVNPTPTASRPTERYDAYSGRPRRSTLTDSTRAPIAVANNLSSRSRPAVVQGATQARPPSPLSRSALSKERDRDYYVLPASSAAPRREHKKIYSVDDGKSRLVMDVDIEPAQHHNRGDSTERGGYRSSGLGG